MAYKYRKIRVILLKIVNENGYEFNKYLEINGL